MIHLPYRAWSLTQVKALLFALLMVSWLAGPQSSRGAITVDNISDPGLNDAVTATAALSTGKLLVGGNFDMVTDAGAEWASLARLNPDGSLDTSFPQQASGFVSGVNAIVPQSSGQVLIAAYFLINSDTLASSYIGRLNLNGSLDSAFMANVPTGMDDVVNTVVALPSGKILVGGAFTTADGNPGHSYLARLNSNGTLDTTFDLGLDGVVHAMVLQADGTVLVGGEFQTASYGQHHGILRLKSDGTIDSSFTASVDTTWEMPGSVESIAVQADNKILLGGAFDTLCGQPRSYFGRLNPDGTLDTAFDPEADSDVTNIVARSNGKILVAGGFSTLDGQAALNIAQLYANGGLDTTFSIVADTQPSSIVTPSAGKIWLGGAFISVTDGTNSSPSYVARLNDSAPAAGGSSTAILSSLVVSSGTLSPTFNASGTSYRVRSLTNTMNITAASQDPAAIVQIRSNGGNYVTLTAGTQSDDFPLSVGPTLFEVRVIATNGTSTRTYTVSATRPPASDATLSDLYLDNTSLDQLFDSAVTSYTATVPYWNTAVVPTVNDPNATVAVAVNGGSYTAVVSGSQTSDLPLVMGGSNTISVKVIAEDGTTSITYAINVTRAAASDATLSDLSIGGGPLDPGFDPSSLSYQTVVFSGSTHVTPVTTDPNATVQVQINSGGYSAVGSGSTSGLLPLVDGSNQVDVLVTAEDGSTQQTYGIVVTRLHSIADSFNPRVSGSNPLVGGTVNAVAIQPDGKIVFGGDFAFVNGQARQRIARFNVDGTLDQTFNPGADDVIRCLVVQSDGKILAGGDFSLLGGLSYAHLGRLNPDGTPDASFAADTDGSVYCVALQPSDGKILVGGKFYQIGGQSRNRIGRMDASGNLDASFDPGTDDAVYSLAITAAGQILVGGRFYYLGGEYRNHIGLLNADGSLDSNFNPGADDDVTCIEVQPADGKVVVGGKFYSLSNNSCNSVGRLNTDGTLDVDLSQGSSITGPVNSVVVQADGKIVAGGAFSLSDYSTGQEVLFNNICRFNADGTLDTGFNPGADASVNCLALQTNGKIVAGGGFTVLGGLPRPGIGRLESIGTAGSDATLSDLALSAGTLLSPLFDPGAFVYTATAQTGAITVTPAATDPNAQILVRLNGGAWNLVTSGSASGLLRLNLGANLIEVAVTSDDGVTTQTYSVNLSRSLITDANLAALSVTSGTLYPDFSPGVTTYSGTIAMGSTSVTATVEDPTATIVVSSGTFSGAVASGSASAPLPLASGSVGTTILITVTAEDTSVRKQYTIHAIRRPSDNADLSALSLNNWPLAPAFNAGTTSYTAGVVSGSAVVVPTTLDPNATVAGRVNGGLWLSASSGTIVATNLVTGSNTIDIRVTSESGSVQKTYTITATRVHAAADLFNPGAGTGTSSGGYAEGVYDLALQADGKMLVGGYFHSLARRPCNNLGRLNADGSFDTGFQPVFKTPVGCLAVQNDQKILVGGQFTTVNGQTRSGLARLTVTGSLDAVFNPTITNSSNLGDPDVFCIAVQTDGKIVIGGIFNSVGGKAHLGLARLSGSGTADATFNPVLSSTDEHCGVSCAVVQPDGKIVIGGWFHAVGGQVHSNIARLNANGTVDSTFQGAADSDVLAIALQADGKILVGGAFSQLDGKPRSCLGRLNKDGTIDASFNTGVLGNGDNGASVDCLRVQTDGRILVGGLFNTVDGQPSGNIRRLWPNGVLENSFVGGANDGVFSMLRQADGKVIVGGWFTTLAGQPRMHIGRLIDDGSLSIAPSNDAYLSKLVVNSGALSPIFSSTGTKPYTLKLTGTSTFSITPTSEDSNALILAQLNGGAYLPVQSRSSVSWPIPLTPSVVNIQVIAANGTTARTTTLNVSRSAMADANLSSLTLSDGVLSPGFVGGTLHYSGTVSRSVTAVTVITEDYTATVQARINGGVYQVIHSGTAGSPLPISSGSNRIEVKVTAENKTTTNTYVMDITRMASSNAALTSLQMTGWPYDFSSGTTKYDLSVFGETVTLSPITTDTNAKIRVQINGGLWSVLPSGRSIQLPLDFGSNSIVVKVIAEDGATEIPYILNIDRMVCGADPAYNPAINSDYASVYSLVVQQDGKAVVGGWFDKIGGGTHNNIVRLLGSGTADSTFNASVSGDVDCMALQKDGKILIGGRFSSAGGQPRTNIARLNANGTLDTTFNPVLTGTDLEAYGIYSVAVQPNGQILIGGNFATVGGRSIPNLARLNGNGSMDITFHPAPDYTVQSIFVRGDGSFVVGGDFSKMGGQSIGMLARFGADGTLDSSFAPNPDSSVNSVIVQGDGSILVGGWFTSIDSQSQSYLARFLPNGQLDTTFAPQIDNGVQTVAVQANGKILLGGQFSSIDDVTRQYIARLNSDGTLDENFDPGADYHVDAIVLQPDGKILVGGEFSTLGGQPRQGLGRLIDSGTNALLSSLTVNGVTISPLFTVTNSDYYGTTSHSSITIKPVTADHAASVQVFVNDTKQASPIPVMSGSLSVPLVLTAGANTVEVQVTAEDGVTTNSYNLSIDQLVSPTADPVTVLSSSSVTLNATVDNDLYVSASNAYFQYGLTTGYTGGKVAAIGDVPADSTPISATLNSVIPGALYHYRPVIVTGTGVIYGDDQVFATARVPLTPLLSQGGGIPDFDGGRFVTFGIPAVNNQSNWAVQTTATGPGISTANNMAICVFDNNASTLSTIVQTADDVPGISDVFGVGGTFTSLGDPVYNDNGQVAFMGTFKTWITSGTGVWLTGTDGTLGLVATTMQQAPGCEPAEFGVFRKLAVTGSGTVLLLADLISGTGAKPTTAAGQGIWAQDTNGNLNLVVRTGTQLVTTDGTTTRAVASLSLLGNPTGPVGQTRSFNNNGNIVFQVVFAGGTQGIYELGASGPLPMAQSGTLLPQGLNNVTATAFGSPAVNDNESMAFQATVAGSNSGIWIVDSSSNAVAMAFTSGSAAGAGGGAFATLGDPLFNNNNAIAFFGKLKTNVGGVTAANASGIWAGNSETFGLIAQANGKAPVPGCAVGTKFLAFDEMVLPNDGGPVFLADLVSGLGGVAAGNNQGVWAEDNSGQLQLMIRKGDGLIVNGAGKIIAGIDFLQSTPQVSGQSRSFNGTGTLMIKITFTDMTQAVYAVTLPFSVK